jgi:predicted metal-binding membrane protein
MLLLFAGGVMNMAVIVGLMVWVGFEKLAPYGRIGAQVTGALMIAGGLWMLAR